mmetsp:Transcript_12621/g.41595  ORF Transcript_12621/g.41595 Transcript_12621/m.41595 type:complete len:355 (+) Transcript_12621:997-2061(+)
MALTKSFPRVASVPARVRRQTARAALRARAAAVTKSDTVAVVGATGNVGRLVALRLADLGYSVRALVRDTDKAEGALARDGIERVQADVVKGSQDELAEALKGCSAVVMTTGVSAFPSSAWGDISLNLGAAGGLKQKIQFSNPPEKVDAEGPRKVVEAWAAANPGKAAKKRFVLMSSVGVTRRDAMPYKMLNGAGVLDCKAAGEAAVMATAEAEGFEFTIVRPGQLFGGPYESAVYLGALFELDKEAGTGRVVMEKGDTIVGDTLRSTLAEVCAAAVASKGAANLDFVVVNEKGDAPSEAELSALLDALPGTEARSEPQGPRIELFAETLAQASGKVGTAVNKLSDSFTNTKDD